MDNDLWGSHTPIDLTIIPGDINIHMLSLSWPNIGSICTYKTIKIPLFLSTIAAEFETHLYAQEKEAKGRKLLWCHGVSTVVLTYRTANLSSGPVTLIVTVPQATVLMAFDLGSTGNEAASLHSKELNIITGLGTEELEYVLKSLCERSLPLIEMEKSIDGSSYLLSSALRNGVLGGGKQKASVGVWESCAASAIGKVIAMDTHR
eukprot:CAMPEP_0119050330 /NCGR_PEP_ID=MMETSP1177-20130426/69283_1 /TAXON_ID=2985 /ORGANISM="Ochromonas sp, Strain CCMP1899" /LENGTH=204 /DNA_ID=CAMNT_0007028599 /DNA_START=478 /DNA_END=1089 /DNA_ORIENTATION=+